MDKRTRHKPATRKRGAQQVRIIGGKFKRRKLKFAGDASLRPTLARTRETLFNWLRAHIHDARCLDAFAGSGVLGLEALSQGARRTTFVEHNREAYAALTRNVGDLNLQAQCEVIRGDALSYLRHAEDAFDIVFLDPPFEQTALLHEALALLASRHLAAGMVYVEARDLTIVNAAAAANGFEPIKQTRAGDTVAVLCTVSNNLQRG